MVNTRTRLEVDVRRDELLKLGRTLFGKHSYDELSIARIAELAGISKGLLYHYFPTKTDFYVETVRAAGHELLRVTEGDLEAPPLDRLKQCIDAYLDYAQDNAQAFVNLMHGGIAIDPRVAAVVEEVRRAFVARVLEGLELKKVTAIQHMGIRGWVGFVEAASLDWLERGARAPKRELVKMMAGQLSFTLLNLGILPDVKRAVARRLKEIFQ